MLKLTVWLQMVRLYCVRSAEQLVQAGMSRARGFAKGSAVAVAVGIRVT